MSLLNEQIKKIVRERLVYHEKDETLKRAMPATHVPTSISCFLLQKFRGKALNAEIKFNKDFIGFDGHFPDNPILPGVVMIRVIITMFELLKGQEYQLSEIKKAKFSEPVSAEENVFFSVKEDKHSDGIKLSGKVVKSEKTIAKISLVIQKIPGRSFYKT